MSVYTLKKDNYQGIFSIYEEGATDFNSAKPATLFYNVIFQLMKIQLPFCCS